MIGTSSASTPRTKAVLMTNGAAPNANVVVGIIDTGDPGTYVRLSSLTFLPGRKSSGLRD